MNLKPIPCATLKNLVKVDHGTKCQTSNISNRQENIEEIHWEFELGKYF